MSKKIRKIGYYTPSKNMLRWSFKIKLDNGRIGKIIERINISLPDEGFYAFNIDESGNVSNIKLQKHISKTEWLKKMVPGEIPDYKTVGLPAVYFSLNDKNTEANYILQIGNKREYTNERNMKDHVLWYNTKLQEIAEYSNIKLHRFTENDISLTWVWVLPFYIYNAISDSFTTKYKYWTIKFNKVRKMFTSTDFDGHRGFHLIRKSMINDIIKYINESESFYPDQKKLATEYLAHFEEPMRSVEWVLKNSALTSFPILKMEKGVKSLEPKNIAATRRLLRNGTTKEIFTKAYGEYNKNIAKMAMSNPLLTWAISNSKNKDWSLFEEYNNNDSMKWSIENYVSFLFCDEKREIIKNMTTKRAIEFVTMDKSILDDLIMMINMSKNYQIEIDWSLTPHALHNYLMHELDKCKRANQLYNYEGLDMFQFVKNGIAWRLADSSHELIDIGRSMDICVGSYADKVSSGSTLIMAGRDIDNEPIACIEFYIDYKKITLVQAKGKYNQRLSDDIIADLETFCKENDFGINTYDMNARLVPTKIIDINFKILVDAQVVDVNYNDDLAEVDNEPLYNDFYEVANYFDDDLPF